MYFPRTQIAIYIGMYAGSGDELSLVVYWLRGDIRIHKRVPQNTAVVSWRYQPQQPSWDDPSLYEYGV